MKEIKNFAIKFIKEHWQEIDLVNCEITETKPQIIKRIKEDLDFAGWIILEVMCWGTKKNYLKECVVETWQEESSYIVIKLGKKYFQYTGEGNLFKEVKPKWKKVLYFE